jgi:hypothetical protein
MRIFASLIILFISIFLPPVVILPLAILHALSWFALELVVFGALIDVYFGGASVLPFYTLIAIAIVFCAEYLKPYLTFYND